MGLFYPHTEAAGMNPEERNTERMIRRATKQGDNYGGKVILNHLPARAQPTSG